MANSNLLYALYAGHAPQMIVDRKIRTVGVLEGVGKKIAELKPEAIVVCSSHFVGDGSFYANTSKKLKCIQDYYNFPQEYYKTTYEAGGAPELGERIAKEAKKLKLSAEPTEEWGLDHSQWIPLLFLAPKKNIPVVSISISNLSKKDHLAWGAAVRNAIEKGSKKVVFVGSGSLTHRLDLIMPGPNKSFPESEVFDNAVKRCVESQNYERLLNFDKSLWETAKPEGELGPLLTTVGVAGKDFKGKQLFHERMNTGVTLSTFEFTKA
ncbi:MAG TPA: hypothetical protein VJA40_04510 [archaeon]|nr:hypothetical protein [archaeon]